MFLRNTYNYTMGYVEVQVEGYFVERFINLCMNRNIEIWDIKRKHDGIIEFKIRNCDMNKINKIAEVTRSNISIVNEVGIPHLAKKYKKRRIFFIVFFCAILGIYLLSLRIWKIEIVGDFSIPINEIREELIQEDFKIGVAKKNLDFDKIKRNIYIRRNDILWMGFEIKGTKAIVEVTERKLPNVDELDGVPCNIVSDKDGVVEKILVRVGNKMVEKGDVVFKGDILVSGVISGEKIDDSYVSSDAEIWLKTWYTGKVSIPYEKDIITKTGKIENKYKIKLGNYIINLSNNDTNFEKYDKITNIKKLTLFGKYELPIELVTTSYEEYNIEEIKITKEQAIAKAKEEATVIAKSTMTANADIIDCDYKMFLTETTVIVRATIECLEAVGVKERIVY